MHTVSLWYLSHWKLKREWSHIYLSPGSRSPVPTGSLRADLGTDRSVHVSTQGWAPDVALGIFTSHKAVPPSLSACHGTLQSQRELQTQYQVLFRPILFCSYYKLYQFTQVLNISIPPFCVKSREYKNFYVTISCTLQISEIVKQDFFLKIHEG